VVDAHDLFMVEDGSADCVVTVSTLGHMRYPQKIMKEIYRILRLGGVVYANVPFIFPFHKDPQDIYRFISDENKVLCADFKCIKMASAADRLHGCVIY